jgi:hypothetical protein
MHGVRTFWTYTAFAERERAVHKIKLAMNDKNKPDPGEDKENRVEENGVEEKKEEEFELQDTCAICLDELRTHPPGEKSGGLIAQVSECRHAYHRRCLASWISKSGGRGWFGHAHCPLCKRRILTSRYLVKWRNILRPEFI